MGKNYYLGKEPMSTENYSSQTPGSIIDKLALKKRLQMLKLFNTYFPEHTIEAILDVGVTVDTQSHSSNYFEKYYSASKKIIALSNQSIDKIKHYFPNIQFQQGDARQLPFADQSVDVVFSSAVIEHVGTNAQQIQMLKECVRVAKHGVFITTPNRWHPIEVHTLLPLIHWLPKKWHRKILKLLNLNFYAQEKNLNLLDQQTLDSFCQQLNLTHFKIKKLYTACFASNLILIIQKC